MLATPLRLHHLHSYRAIAIWSKLLTSSWRVLDLNFFLGCHLEPQYGQLSSSLVWYFQSVFYIPLFLGNDDFNWCLRWYYYWHYSAYPSDGSMVLLNLSLYYNVSLAHPYFSAFLLQNARFMTAEYFVYIVCQCHTHHHCLILQSSRN